MKKVILIIILFAIVLIVNQYNVNAMIKTKKCQKELTLKNININNLNDYLKSVDNKIIKLCTKNYCDYFKYDNKENSVNTFLESYYNYLLTNYNEDVAISNTKNIIFTKLIVNTC